MVVYTYIENNFQVIKVWFIGLISLNRLKNTR